MKKFIINVISFALSALASYFCGVGCMEYLEEHSFFGLSESVAFFLALIFCLFVLAFSFQGFKNFLYSATDKENKK